MAGLVCVCSLFVKSLFVSLCFMLVNSRSLEFVLKYRFVSPLLMALIMVGGWYEDAWMYPIQKCLARSCINLTQFLQVACTHLPYRTLQD